MGRCDIGRQDIFIDARHARGYLRLRDVDDLKITGHERMVIPFFLEAISFNCLKSNSLISTLAPASGNAPLRVCTPVHRP